MFSGNTPMYISFNSNFTSGALAASYQKAANVTEERVISELQDSHLEPNEAVGLFAIEAHWWF